MLYLKGSWENKMKLYDQSQLLVGCNECSYTGSVLEGATHSAYCFLTTDLKFLIVLSLNWCFVSLMGLGSMSRVDTPGVSTHRCRLGHSGTVGVGQRHQQSQQQPRGESTGSLHRDGTKPSSQRSAGPSISKPTPIAAVKISSPV